MTKTRIGVVRGGPSSEYEISLRTGAAVLDALDKEKYEPLDIVISKDGIWHLHGLEIKPHEVVRRVDVIFNALHGYYGEDGKIQQLLESYCIPFTGSGSLSSAIGMNKVLAKEYFRRAGLKTPVHVLIEGGTAKKEINATKAYLLAHSRFPLPYIVKPISAGSSIGVSIVKSRNDFALALDNAFEFGHSVMVEEYIPGIEANVCVIQGYRGKDLYALPPVEIRSVNRTFFDYEAKYKGNSNEIVPATFSTSIKTELEKLAIAVHSALGLRHYSRTDFIISPRRGIFILEINTLPGLTDESLVPKALKAVDSSLSELAEHLISLALDE
jgi:D-alanine-D-alanine ligase